MFFDTYSAVDDTLALEDAYRHTDEITRVNSKTFYLATALLPREAQRAIRALYAFCRATDDLVDKAGATMSDVLWWQNALLKPQARQHHPILLCWTVIREKYNVDVRYQNELVDGVAMDLFKTRYATWNELERYCYLVASTVGLLSMPIIGLAKGARFEDAMPYAIKMGVALQLTNILRDVHEDAQHGRIYLPQTDLARFGVTEEEILRGAFSARFAALMKFEIARARELFAESLAGIALLAPSARPAVGAAALLYRAILDRIEDLNYNVFKARAHTTAWQKLFMLPAILIQVALLRAPLSANPPPLEMQSAS